VAEWRGIAHCAEQTESIGAALAATLPAITAAPAAVYLQGELGAGKTTLARGFLRRLGVTAPVRSPTYTLLECYELADRVVVHLDLYRLRDASELEMLGVRELARAQHLWLIEWPERAHARLPAADLSVRLEVGAAGHAVALTGQSQLGSAWLARTVEILPRSS